MVNVQYSVLCHYPSIISKDCITLGVLLYNKNEKECVFQTTQNWNRVKTFNDELDIELVKLQLEGIKDEVYEYSRKKNFNLQEYTKFYINELKFSETVNILVDDFNSFVYECKKQYLRFDLDKKERPTIKDQVRFLKDVLKQSEINYTNGQINGYFNENVKFDFIIGDYAFKLFRFDGKKENRLIKSVKDWAYDAYKLKERYKIIFVTDIDFEECTEYKTIFNILKEECERLLNFNEVIPFINKI